MSSLRQLGATSAIVLALTLIIVYIFQFVLFTMSDFEPRLFYDMGACFQFASNNQMLWHFQNWLTLVFGAALIPSGIVLHHRYHKHDNTRGMVVRAFRLLSAALWIATGAL